MPNSPAIYGGNDTSILLQRSLITKDGRTVPSINYINNSDFERNSTTGWATYADAAASTPVDGTGGSPASTFTATSTNPLRGTYSGLLTKSAANRQGEGVSFDFTIPRADRSKALGISFDFEIASGTFASGDVAVYIYDVTNATLITPSSVNIATGSGTFQALFAATTSTSYRMILHIATTSTSAYTLAVDNVRVGLFESLLGLAGNDWQAYTPTTQGFGTLALSQFWWRRVGDSIEVQALWTNGTVNGSQAQISLPSGLTFSTFTNRTLVGKAVRNTSSALTNKQITVLAITGETAFTFSIDDYTAAIAPLTAQAGSTILNNGDSVSFFARAPISTWTSNVTLADRAVEEYVFNTSTSTSANDTTSFGYGTAGAQIQNITAALSRRVRFQTTVQPTDVITFEVSTDRIKWTPVGTSAVVGGDTLIPMTFQNTTSYGAGRLFFQNATDMDVFFGQYVSTTGASYASAGAAYSGGVGSGYWRVRKVAGGAVVGFPIGVQNMPNTAPTVVGFNDFNPSDLIGTTTNAGARTIVAAGGGNITVSAISSGTVTFTFNDAGSYLVTVNNAHRHGAAYAYSIVICTFGGTAGRFGGTADTMEASQEPTFDRNGAGSCFEWVTATAGQTLTVNTTFALSGSGTTGQHTANAGVVIQRVA